MTYEPFMNQRSHIKSKSINQATLDRPAPVPPPTRIITNLEEEQSKIGDQISQPFDKCHCMFQCQTQLTNDDHAANSLPFTGCLKAATMIL